MKTVLTAATVATLTFVPNLPARVGNSNQIEASPEIRQRETRYQREDRLRAAHRRSSRAQRETRHEREERLREAGQNPWLEVWRDPV